MNVKLINNSNSKARFRYTGLALLNAAGAAALAASMLAAPVIGSAQSAMHPSHSPAKRHKKDARLPAVIIFPADSKGGSGDTLVDLITEVEESRVSANESYRGVLFARSLPTVERGLLDQSLSPDEVRGPFDDNSKVNKLARLMSYPFAIVSSLDDYQYDANQNTVSIVLSARLLDLRGARLHVVRAVTLPAKITEKGAGATEDSMATEVVRATTEKLMSQLLQPVAGMSPNGMSH